jgi:hypothetical protein
MATDHRIEENGQRLDFTCENAAYKTNVDKGEPHSDSHRYCGSVFPEPIKGCLGDEYTLWLEHVTVKNDPKDECYWLIWYKDGKPTIPLSAIWHKEDIAKMQRLLASFIP